MTSARLAGSPENRTPSTLTAVAGKRIRVTSWLFRSRVRKVRRSWLMVAADVPAEGDERFPPGAPPPPTCTPATRVEPPEPISPARHPHLGEDVVRNRMRLRNCLVDRDRRQLPHEQRVVRDLNAEGAFAPSRLVVDVAGDGHHPRQRPGLRHYGERPVVDQRARHLH